MKDVDVIILTFNEAMHIGRAIESVHGIAKNVFVVDSQSTDGTVEIAESLGATVFQNKFINQARQFQWALDHLPLNANWTMRLDADELIEADLAKEIVQKIALCPLDIVGLNLQRKHIFMGRWVKHGGRYPVTLLRVWRSGHAFVEDKWMDEHIVVRGGRTTTLRGGFQDCNLNDLSFFTAKHNQYATREAIEVLTQKYSLLPEAEAVTVRGASRQAALKRWLKRNIYNRLPFTVSATAYFLWRYIGQLGFMDGRSGLIYHFLQGFWYRFLVGAKVLELELALTNTADKDLTRDEISRLTGFDVRKV